MVLILVILDSLNRSEICKSILKTFAVFVIILCLLTGCSKPSDNDLSNDKNYTTNANDIQNADQYVKIYTGDTSEDHFFFYYDLYDKRGNLIKHDCTYMNEPDVTMLSKDIIRISVQTGTGLSTRWTYYYDLNSDKISQIFYNVLAEKENYVAFFRDKKVIISDMFDEKIFTKEIQLKHDLSNCSDPIENVTFSDDLSEINVTYLSGAKFKEIKEIIPLN